MKKSVLGTTALARRTDVYRTCASWKQKSKANNGRILTFDQAASLPIMLVLRGTLGYLCNCSICTERPRRPYYSVQSEYLPGGDLGIRGWLQGRMELEVGESASSRAGESGGNEGGRDPRTMAKLES
jgi:hypothetical protein